MLLRVTFKYITTYNIKNMSKALLKAASLCYKGLQKERIAISNRLRNFNVAKEDIAQIKELLSPALRSIGKVIRDAKAPELGLVSTKIIIEYLEKKMRDLCEYYLENSGAILWQKWIKYVEGWGPTLAAAFITTFDINKAKSPSSYWAYAGLTVKEGRAVRRKRGEKTVGNPKAKNLVYLIADSLIKKKGGYRRLYERFREREESEQKRFKSVPAEKLDSYYLGWRFVKEDIFLTRRSLEKIRKDYRGERVILEVPPKVRRLRAYRKVEKVLLAHAYIVEDFLRRGVVNLHYAAAYLAKEDYYKHGYIYMPVIDKVVKPDWWHQLWEAYEKIGIKPVEV